MVTRGTSGTPKKAAPNATSAQPRRRSAPDWAERFLSELVERGVIRYACAAASVSRSQVYRRRDSDPAFAAAMAAALEDGHDALELEARRRAKDGVTRPIFGSGGTGMGTVQVGEVQEYSDTLLIFLLKAARPEKYRDHVRHEHAGHDGGAIVTEHVVVYIPDNGRDSAK